MRCAVARYTAAVRPSAFYGEAGKRGDLGGGVGRHRLGGVPERAPPRWLYPRRRTRPALPTRAPPNLSGCRSAPYARAEVLIDPFRHEAGSARRKRRNQAVELWRA